jgi:hypothetical protein
MTRRNFLKSIAAAAIGAGLCQVPLVSPTSVAAKVAALDALDYAYADMCMNVSLANFWRGTPMGASAARRAMYQATLVKRLMDKEGIKYLT